MAPGDKSFNHLVGARLVAQDGQFLGIISFGKFKPDSINNKTGEYGSHFKPFSIANELGKYGSSLSPYSAYNERAQFPPKIILNDSFIGYLTCNQMLSPRVDPRELLEWLDGK
jgi:hypothetical protein